MMRGRGRATRNWILGVVSAALALGGCGGGGGGGGGGATLPGNNTASGTGGSAQKIANVEFYDASGTKLDANPIDASGPFTVRFELGNDHLSSVQIMLHEKTQAPEDGKELASLGCGGSMGAVTGCSRSAAFSCSLTTGMRFSCASGYWVDLARVTFNEPVLTVVATDFSNPFNITTDTRSYEIELPTNAVPVASAGSDQRVVEGATVTLDGSGSADEDGTIVSYAWTQVSGPSVALSDPDAAVTTFTAPAAGDSSLTFRLTVTDDGGSQASDTVVVTVFHENQPPTADAGSDTTVTEGATVTLDGSASADPDGSLASYAWTQVAGPAVTLADPTAAVTTFVAPAQGATSLTFQLTVTDDEGREAVDTVVVNVAEAGSSNEAPVAEAGPDQTVTEGATVTLDGAASSDPDGTIAGYSWRQVSGPDVTLSGADNAAATFVAPSLGNTSLTFELTVTDDGGLQASDTVVVTVQAENQAPVADAGADTTVTPGALVTLDGSGSMDPDGTVVSYAWTQVSGPDVTLSDPDAAVTTFAAPTLENVTLTFELTVTDDAGQTSVDSVSVAVLASQGGTWTLINSPSPVEYMLRSVAASGTRVVAAEYAAFDRVLVSDDGKVWNVATAPMPGSPSQIIWAEGLGQFVLVGWYSGVATSPDGITWTSQSLPTTVHLSTVCWSGSELLAIGKEGSIGGNLAVATSADGETWSVTSLSHTKYIEDVVWNGERFIAVGGGQGPIILTSTDGISWDDVTPADLTTMLLSVAWGNNRGVAVGSAGVVWTTSDGMTWEKISKPGTCTLHNVRFLTDRFVAVGSCGTVIESLDGTNWSSIDAGTDEQLIDIAETPDGWVIVGGSPDTGSGQTSVILTNF